MSKDIEKKLKIVGLIPFWSDKKGGVDLQKIAGKYLIEYTVELLNSSSFVQETIIYSSNKKVMGLINKDLSVKYLNRPTLLDKEDVSIEEIISQFMNDYDFDILVLVRPFCPFISRHTIDECINRVITGRNDSAFTAVEFQKLSWFKGKPLNFNTGDPSLKKNSIDAVIIEQGLTHIVSKDSFIKNKSRDGINPFIKIIDLYEGHEVENNHDYEVAELIVNSGMYKGPYYE